MKNELDVWLISDFNLDLFGRYLDHSVESPPVNARTLPFGQLHQTLLDPPDADPERDVALIWTRPEAALESFRSAAEFTRLDHDILIEQVDRFADRILALAGRFRFLLVATWTLPARHRGYGLLDLQPGLGLSSLIARLNLRLAERLNEDPRHANIFALDSQRWLLAGGPDPEPPRMWYAAKVPFANKVFEHAAREIKAALRGLHGRARKLVIVDLDHTLWGGVVGELGPAGVKLGGHSSAGEAFQDFQRQLKALTRRGIQLAIASKNDEATALEAIDQHPEMILRREDFAAWRINWRDKASNISEILGELNLGAESAVFIDDQPAERARVAEALPAVLVPEWPADPSLYASALHGLAVFDAPAMSEEDASRSRMYQEERQRQAGREHISSIEDWLMTLGTEVRGQGLTQIDLPRTAQLFNKTNQMNLATRRLSQGEIAAWAEAPHRDLFTFRVKDRFGDMGLSAVLGLEARGKVAQIVDFILSCRVMGREVEKTVLHHAVDWARRRGLESVQADFLVTERNGPCLKFWRSSEFEEKQDLHFTWDASEGYGKPPSVTLHMVQGEDENADGAGKTA